MWILIVQEIIILETEWHLNLKYQPIITINKGKIQQVSATDIMAVVSEYSSSRGVKDEANDIPVDDNLFDIDEINQR